ncbi:hypothetical protein MBENS4_2335 [Novosphingobium sp. MBES04]|nr:hypothetical protein MBENS4_2335 [Novosphingobium sp. MBES04]
MEEAGVRLGDLEPVSNIWPIPPVSTERVQIYLAPYSAEDRIGPGGGCPEENEQIAACEWNFDTLRELTFAGQLTDAKTLIAVQALMLRHPELWRPLRND